MIVPVSGAELFYAFAVKADLSSLRHRRRTVPAP